MTIEVSSSKPKETEFTIDGEALFIRKMPLRLGLKLQGAVGDGSTEVPAEVVAGSLFECVVLKDGSNAFESVEAVLDLDTAVMLRLFSEVSSKSFEVEDARKN